MKKEALIIIDVQNDMFAVENPVYNGNELIQKIKYLITKAKANSTPIYFVQHNEPVGAPLENGTKGWEIHPEIAPNEGSLTIQKDTPDSFHNTSLDLILKEQKIEHIILAGIQSDLCVDTTCRRAYSLGYNVTLVKDGHSTWDSNEINAQQIINHHNQVLSWFADVKKASAIEFK